MLEQKANENVATKTWTRTILIYLHNPERSDIPSSVNSYSFILIFMAADNVLNDMSCLITSTSYKFLTYTRKVSNKISDKKDVYYVNTLLLSNPGIEDKISWHV